MKKFIILLQSLSLHKCIEMMSSIWNSIQSNMKDQIKLYAYRMPHILSPPTFSLAVNDSQMLALTHARIIRHSGRVRAPWTVEQEQRGGVGLLGLLLGVMHHASTSRITRGETGEGEQSSLAQHKWATCFSAVCACRQRRFFCVPRWFMCVRMCRTLHAAFLSLRFEEGGFCLGIWSHNEPCAINKYLHNRRTQRKEMQRIHTPGPIYVKSLKWSHALTAQIHGQETCVHRIHYAHTQKSAYVYVIDLYNVYNKCRLIWCAPYCYAVMLCTFCSSYWKDMLHTQLCESMYTFCIDALCVCVRVGISGSDETQLCCGIVSHFLLFVQQFDLNTELTKNKLITKF